MSTCNEYQNMLIKRDGFFISGIAGIVTGILLALIGQIFEEGWVYFTVTGIIIALSAFLALYPTKKADEKLKELSSNCVREIRENGFPVTMDEKNGFVVAKINLFLECLASLIYPNESYAKEYIVSLFSKYSNIEMKRRYFIYTEVRIIGPQEDVERVLEELKEKLFESD